MSHPIEILERYWNYTSFKPLQEDCINAVIANEDTFVLMPTGGGKSMCFQIPALAKDGICIVVSPLIALMKNQVQALKDKGIKAMALTSGISFKDLDTLLDNCIYGNYKFLYLSPERLQQELVQNRIQQMQVNLIAVDEAHCISQWGNDFRPSYKNISILRQLHPQVNCVALTASATPEVIEDVIKELDFLNQKVFKQSFFRKNLAYVTLHEEDKFYRLETILKTYNTSSIVYVRNRKSTIEVSAFLESKDISSTFYHGGLSNDEKDRNFYKWMHDQKHVMVATNAFGMGIDKPNVKTVIHLNLPESLESYFQEAGRAGRNGEKAFAIILKNNSDDVLVKNQFINVLPTIDFIKIVYRKLCNYFQISYGEGEYQTFDFNFYQFCKTYKFNTLKTYNALQALDRTSVISLTKQFNNKTSVQFIINNNQIFKYLEKHPNYATIVKTILRTYGGIFEHKTKINTNLISEKASIKEDALIATLKQFEKDNIIWLKLMTTDAEVTFIEPREDDKTINRIAKTIEQQTTLKQAQVQAVLNYTNTNSICKSKQLLTYFGEKNVSDCGICSVCLKQGSNKSEINTSQIKDSIHRLLKDKSLSSRLISEALNYPEKDINCILKLMLEHNVIAITDTNTYKLLNT